MGEKIRTLVDAHKSEINLAVSSDNRTFEEDLIRENPVFNIPEIPQSYRRYGYGLLSYVSKKMVYDWFEDYQKIPLFNSIQSKITNSGMSAIDLTISTLATVLGTRKIIAPENIYFASDELINMYKGNLLTDVIRFKSKSDLENIIESNNTEEFILFLEVCSNSPDMTFYNEEELIKYSRSFGNVLVDGSLIGLSRINPSMFDNGNMIYIESLSKNYHQEESSKITAGITVYPKELEEAFQKKFYCNGCYLQLNDLMDVPIDLYSAGKKRIEKIAENVQEFYVGVKHQTPNNLVNIPEISDDLRKTPLVLFLKFQDNKKLKEYVSISGIPKRGSFGHDETYILPIGLMWSSAPPGLARIAFGTKKYSFQYTKALGDMKT
ncbi:MAG: hypothetical protein ACOCUT_00400 [bacterium]